MSRKNSKGPMDAQTKTTTFTSEGFTRTALVMDSEGNGGSLDILDASGKRVAQINLFLGESDGQECFIADVIDVDGRFTQRRALAFASGARHCLDVPKEGNLVSTDFRRSL